MRYLVTGATGFLASYLIPELKRQGHTLYGLSRHGPDVVCDITKFDLLGQDMPEVDAVIHTAAALSFNKNRAKEIWQVNYNGTTRLLLWMRAHNIKRLFHVSTAYLSGKNDYEQSKKYAEMAIHNLSSKWPEFKATIFRPSIIIGDSGLRGLPPPAGAYAVIRAIERAKVWFEKRSGAPPLRFEAKVKANPDGHLNLIPVDVVSGEMTRLINKDEVGLFHLTHPSPPSIKSLEPPVSEAIGIDVRFLREFEPNALDRMISGMIKELIPYLNGDDFPSDIDCPELSQDFLYHTAKTFLQG